MYTSWFNAGVWERKALHMLTTYLMPWYATSCVRGAEEISRLAFAWRSKNHHLFYRETGIRHALDHYQSIQLSHWMRMHLLS